MAGKLPPVGWLQRDSPLEPLLDAEPGPVLRGGRTLPEAATQRDGTGRGLPELAFQGLVYGLVLAPPLRLAIGNPASFFGMLNVRRDAPPPAPLTTVARVCPGCMCLLVVWQGSLACVTLGASIASHVTLVHWHFGMMSFAGKELARWQVVNILDRPQRVACRWQGHTA